jgi:hypothetical protein
MLEGIMSRGDERVGEMIEDAYLHGARLDAWTDFFKKEVWEAAMQKHDVSCRYENTLPWDIIDSKVTKNYLKNEEAASKSREFTLPCNKNCTHSCGVCGFDGTSVVKNTETFPVLQKKPESHNVPHGVPAKKADPDTVRVLFQFEKKGKAVFLSHLNLINVFQMAFRRTGADGHGILVLYSAGFNPTPLLDFASPLPLGVAGLNEAATIDLDVAAAFDAKAFVQALDAVLPDGLRIMDALCVTIRTGVKKHSPAALFCGSVYALDGKEIVVMSNEEKAFKEKIIAGRGSLRGLERKRPLALDPKTRTTGNYMDIYHALYLQ